MHFATRVRTWHVPRLYSEIALPRNRTHVYIYTFLLRKTADTVTSQNTDLSCILYTKDFDLIIFKRHFAEFSMKTFSSWMQFRLFFRRYQISFPCFEQVITHWITDVTSSAFGILLVISSVLPKLWYKPLWIWGGGGSFELVTISSTPPL
jgi:hypothetical protein